MSQPQPNWTAIGQSIGHIKSKGSLPAGSTACQDKGIVVVSSPRNSSGNHE